ncbi:MAG: transposase [Bacteroidota bacterium]
MKRYKEKYRNESGRLTGWDYSGSGQYFITINTYDRACLFGDIVDGKMILNDFGKIAADEWFKSFEMRQELFLGEFILMPNHLHAIVGLESGSVGNGFDAMDETNQMNGTIDNVGTHGRASLHYRPFQRKPKSISSFIAGYKSAVLNKIDDLIDERQIPMQKFNRRNPLWQANYYDHIIRDGLAYVRISEYIRRNPEKWKGK